MKTTGIVRKVDELGRIVLPVELRRNFKIQQDTPIEVFVDGNKIILKKYGKTCTCCGDDEQENLKKVGDTYLCDDCIKKFSEQ